MAGASSLGRRWLAGSVLGLGCAAVSACAPIYENHGYVPASTELSQVKAGETKADVEKQIGSPSVQGLKGDDAWYYVQSRWRHFGPFAPREVDRQGVRVNFSSAGRVTSVDRFGAQQGNEVAISQRVTQSNVKGVSLLDQLFRDLGQFNPGAILNKSQ